MTSPRRAPSRASCDRRRPGRGGRRPAGAARPAGLALRGAGRGRTTGSGSGLVRRSLAPAAAPGSSHRGAAAVNVQRNAKLAGGWDVGLDDCLWPLDRRDALTAALASAAGIAQLGPANRFELATPTWRRRSARGPAPRRRRCCAWEAARGRCWGSSATRAPGSACSFRRHGRHSRQRGAVGLLARADRVVVTDGRRGGRGAGGLRRGPR